jgi:hypothetical protein
MLNVVAPKRGSFFIRERVQLSDQGTLPRRDNLSTDGLHIKGAICIASKGIKILLDMW